MRVKAEIADWFGANSAIPASGRIHFVGIGGSGMSAIARVLIREGREVSGSDRELSPTLDDLRKRGADVRTGHRAENVHGAACVIVTDAVELDTNPETREAKALGIPLVRRSQALGQIVNSRRPIAVTGTHGKSTTTALLSAILTDAGFDPLAVVGPSVENWDENVRLGRGEYAVVESCEAFDGFQDIEPFMVVLTNVEPDHLEFHGSLDALEDSIARFISKAQGEPKLVYCAEDDGASTIARRLGGGVPYGFGLEPFNAFYDSGVLKTALGNIRLRIPGRHMALNALGAATAAFHLGVSPEHAVRSLERAPGCKQRLELIGEVRGVSVINDYAHHPTAIRASFEALREAYPNHRLVAVHQPHTYTRTRDMRKEFVEVLATADVVVLTDICPARERPIPGVSATLLVEDLESLGKEVHFVPSRHLLPRYVPTIVREGDVVTSFGAGNISSFAPEFYLELKRETEPLRVSVFAGGESSEREISLLSGLMVAEALERKGYHVTMHDPNEVLLYWGDTHPLIGPGRPDIVFPALHGTGAEDGRVQALLELLHLPYVGSGVEACSLTMDKQRTKEMLRMEGYLVPGGVILKKGETLAEFPAPAIVKPNAQGSTIGLAFVESNEQLEPAIERAFKYDDSVLIEEWLEGIEISVPVIEETSLPAVEIVPRSGRYDFESKYTPGATEELVPARIPAEIANKAAEIAISLHKLFGLQDMSRTDMIVRGSDIYILEINTIPGLTPTSLLPRSAESVGIDFDSLCERILQSALRRYGIEKPKS